MPLKTKQKNTSRVFQICSPFHILNLGFFIYDLVSDHTILKYWVQKDDEKDLRYTCSSESFESYEYGYENLTVSPFKNILLRPQIMLRYQEKNLIHFSTPYF